MERRPVTDRQFGPAVELRANSLRSKGSPEGTACNETISARGPTCGVSFILRSPHEDLIAILNCALHRDLNAGTGPTPGSSRMACATMSYAGVPWQNLPAASKT